VSLLFDRPAALRTSFPRLRAELARQVPTRAADVPLQPVTLGDGSTIRLPQAWRVTSTGKGSVDLAGPRGEMMSLGAAAPVYSRAPRVPGMPANYVLVAPCCDPVRAMVTLFPQVAALARRTGLPSMQFVKVVEVHPVEWPNAQAAYVLSDLNIGGRGSRGFNLVAAMHGYGDPWTYYTSGVSAPADVFQDEFSTMLRVWKSYSVNPAVFQERLDNAVKAMNESWQLLRAGMTEATRASLSAAEGWDQYVRGVETIEHTDTGHRWEASTSSVQNLVDSLNTTGSGQWRIVPSSELIK
jgi:hypothetical protein